MIEEEEMKEIKQFQVFIKWVDWIESAVYRSNTIGKKHNAMFPLSCRN